MSRRGHGGVYLLTPKEKCFSTPSQSRLDEDLKVIELNTGIDNEIIEINVDIKEEKDVLKTVYEMFHAEIGAIPLLTPQEEKELSRLIQEEGDKEAYQKFVLANLRLVVACAKKVKDRMGQQGILSFMDLVHEGILGLVIAVKRFDYKKNTRFSTYGIPWIYQRIKMALVQHRYGFRVPGYAGTSVHTMSDQIKAFKEGNLEAIPEDTDMERIKALARISGTTVPIDYPEESGKGSFTISPEKVGSSSGNFSSMPMDLDETDSQYEENFFRENTLQILREKLTEKEYDVLCRRFGLGVYGCQTLSDIAEIYDKSSEHIRNVIKKSMDKLRNSPDLQKFCNTWDIL